MSSRTHQRILAAGVMSFSLLTNRRRQTKWARQTDHPRGATEDDEDLEREDGSGCVWYLCPIYSTINHPGTSALSAHIWSHFIGSTNFMVLSNISVRWWVDTILEESLFETVHKVHKEPVSKSQNMSRQAKKIITEHLDKLKACTRILFMDSSSALLALIQICCIFCWIKEFLRNQPQKLR